MNEAKEALFVALNALAESGGHPSKVRELGSFIRRNFPTAVQRVAAIVNPARFGNKEPRERGTVQGSTWVHPSKREDQPKPRTTSRAVTPASPAAPAKKKPAVEETVEAAPPDNKAADEVFEPDDILGKTDEEIIALCGGLPAVKAHLLDHFGVTVAKNAPGTKAMQVFRETYEIIRNG